MDSSEKLARTTQTLLNCLLILGSLSALFYIAGHIESVAYFTSIGIERIFLDFSYQEYVLRGLFGSIYFLAALFVLTIMFIVWFRLNDLRDKIITQQKKVEADPSLDDLRAAVEKMISKIPELFWSEYKGFILILLTGIVVFAGYAFYKENFAAAYSAVSGGVILLQIILIAYLFKTLVKETKFTPKVQLLAVPSLFAYVIVFPFINGYTQAKIDVARDSFPEYLIFLEEKNRPFKGALLYKNNELYFFKTDNAKFVVPRDNIYLIKSITKPDH